MKNYKVQPDMSSCQNCTHSFVICDYDGWNTYYCTDGEGERPLCVCAEMSEVRWDATEDERNKAYDAWEEWACKNEVSRNGICEHYEKEQPTIGGLTWT